MPTTTSTRAAAVTLAGATLLMLVSPAAGAAAPIPHPTEPDAVILHVETSPNGFGGEYDDGGSVTIFPDRVEFEPTQAGGAGADTAPVVFQLDEASVQRALRAARRAGLLRGKQRDYGDAGVTDQGTTVVEIHAGSVDRTISVYALLLPEGDRGLAPGQQRARKALRAFVHKVTTAAFYGVP